MKFQKDNILPSTNCISHRCKTCQLKSTCDKVEKLEKEYEPLLYKPFEKLEEKLEEILNERD